LAGEPVSPALYFPNAEPALANLPRWYPGQTEHPLIANSKTGGFGCCAISNRHPAPRRLPDVQENHVACRLTPNYTEPRHNKNQGSMLPFGVAGGICMLRNVDHEELPTASFPPKWIFGEVDGQ
jgi:hypothetical protein